MDIPTLDYGDNIVGIDREPLGNRNFRAQVYNDQEE